jgi:hypothetical protein
MAPTVTGTVVAVPLCRVSTVARLPVRCTADVGTVRTLPTSLVTIVMLAFSPMMGVEGEVSRAMVTG